MLALQDCELLLQNEVFEQEAATRAKRRTIDVKRTRMRGSMSRWYRESPVQSNGYGIDFKGGQRFGELHPLMRLLKSVAPSASQVQE